MNFPNMIIINMNNLVHGLIGKSGPFLDLDIALRGIKTEFG